jgi:hypothetical protein
MNFHHVLSHHPDAAIVAVILYLMGVALIGTMCSMAVYNPGHHRRGTFVLATLVTLFWPIAIPLWLIWVLFSA